jgi:demethylmenaquinone methyltransferase/2-methoxy-6-polyprenyl-1,4-benzoquinol methylase
LSRWYDLLESSWERKPREATLASLKAAPGAAILEIGCGTGNSMGDLSKKAGKNGCVYGIDLSAGMLHRASSRLFRDETTSNAFLTQADAVLLPFADDLFDIIFLSFTLELFSPPEIRVVLAECSRVLKPGAQLGAVAVSRSGGWKWMILLYENLHRAFPQVVDCAPIDLILLLEEAGYTPVNRRNFSLFGIGVESVTALK